MDKENRPFLTREMLTYQGSSTFQLVVGLQSAQTDPVYVRVGTKDNVLTFQLSPDGTKIMARQTIGITDVPIWVSVFDNDGSYTAGDLLVTVALAINGDRVHQLCGGYVTKQQSISWPIAQNNDPIKNIGVPNLTTSSDPAAGSELSISVPTGQLWVPIGCSFQLVTDATAVSRVVHIVFTGSGKVMAECISPNAQTASLTRNYRAVIGNSLMASADDNDLMIGLPADLILYAGMTITTQTTNLQAGDNFGTMTLFYKRYFTA